MDALDVTPGTWSNEGMNGPVPTWSNDGSDQKMVLKVEGSSDRAYGGLLEQKFSEATGRDQVVESSFSKGASIKAKSSSIDTDGLWALPHSIMTDSVLESKRSVDLGEDVPFFRESKLSSYSSQSRSNYREPNWGKSSKHSASHHMETSEAPPVRDSSRMSTQSTTQFAKVREQFTSWEDTERRRDSPAESPTIGVSPSHEIDSPEPVYPRGRIYRRPSPGWDEEVTSPNNQSRDSSPKRGSDLSTTLSPQALLLQDEGEAPLWGLKDSEDSDDRPPEKQLGSESTVNSKKAAPLSSAAAPRVGQTVSAPFWALASNNGKASGRGEEHNTGDSSRLPVRGALPPGLSNSLSTRPPVTHQESMEASPSQDSATRSFATQGRLAAHRPNVPAWSELLKNGENHGSASDSRGQGQADNYPTLRQSEMEEPNNGHANAFFAKNDETPISDPPWKKLQLPKPIPSPRTLSADNGSSQAEYPPWKKLQGQKLAPASMTSIPRPSPPSQINGETASFPWKKPIATSSLLSNSTWAKEVSSYNETAGTRDADPRSSPLMHHAEYPPLHPSPSARTMKSLDTEKPSVPSHETPRLPPTAVQPRAYRASSPSWVRPTGSRDSELSTYNKERGSNGTDYFENHGKRAESPRPDEEYPPQKANSVASDSSRNSKISDLINKFDKSSDARSSAQSLPGRSYATRQRGPSPLSATTRLSEAQRNDRGGSAWTPITDVTTSESKMRAQSPVQAEHSDGAASQFKMRSSSPTNPTKAVITPSPTKHVQGVVKQLNFSSGSAVSKIHTPTARRLVDSTPSVSSDHFLSKMYSSSPITGTNYSDGVSSDPLRAKPYSSPDAKAITPDAIARTAPIAPAPSQPTAFFRRTHPSSSSMPNAEARETKPPHSVEGQTASSYIPTPPSFDAHERANFKNRFSPVAIDEDVDPYVELHRYRRRKEDAKSKPSWVRGVDY